MGHTQDAARGLVVTRELHPALASMPGHLLWRSHARVTLAIAEVLPPDVDLNAYGVLRGLADGATRSQQELADMVGSSRTTVARVAADLSARDLVQRVRNPVDRRSYALTRTPAGDLAVERWSAHADAVEAHVTASFTDAEREDLRALLLRIVGAEIAPDAPVELRTNLAFLVSRIHVRMHRDFLAALEPIALEPRLFGALKALTATGPVAQADLARLLGVSGPSTVQIVDSLEERGLVERRRDSGDRRQQLLHLTPSAPAALAAASEIAHAVITPSFDPLDEADTTRLVGLLQRFVTGS